jgi:hypothetical protein
LGRNFLVADRKVNSEMFKKITQSLPQNLWAKHKNSIIQIEATLLVRQVYWKKILMKNIQICCKRNIVFIRKNIN